LNNIELHKFKNTKVFVMEVSSLLKNCFIVVDKPRGPPSAQVGNWVRDIVNVQKSGHIGTLDPAVSGVLIIALGKAVKLSKFLSGQDKEYVAIMQLHKKVSEDKIHAVFKKFTGDIEQMPPLRSAVAKKLRTRTIHNMEILDIQDKMVLFKVKCQGGTYIRKLIFDMGKKLGCGANMLELRRTQSGKVKEKESYSIYEIKDAYWEHKEKNNSTKLLKMLRSPEDLLDFLPVIKVKNTAVPSIAYGSPIYRKALLEETRDFEKDDFVRIYSEDNLFLCTAKIINGPEMYAKIDVNLLDKEEFNKKWKKEKSDSA
jgi:predicted rRNA pseudouridine synthase